MHELQTDDVARMFGQNLKQIREDKGWSQSELARQMKARGWDTYSQVAISRTEDGVRSVRLDEALALAEVLEIELTDFISADMTETELKTAVQNTRRAGQDVRDAVGRYVYAQDLLKTQLKKAQQTYNSADDLSSVQRGGLLYWIKQAEHELTRRYTDHVDGTNGDN